MQTEKRGEFKFMNWRQKRDIKKKKRKKELNIFEYFDIYHRFKVACINISIYTIL